jgi:dTMP kinase
VVRPGLEAGRVVIADRFELSTLAYQGAGRGLPPDEIVRSNRLATGGLAPRATLLLELPPAEGARRQALAAKRPDRMEREAEDFHARVARGYHDLADRVDGVIRVDARGTVEEVQARLWASLRDRFPETFGPAGGS